VGIGNSRVDRREVEMVGCQGVGMGHRLVAMEGPVHLGKAVMAYLVLLELQHVSESLGPRVGLFLRGGIKPPGGIANGGGGRLPADNG
jgi:hypothetical protein